MPVLEKDINSASNCLMMNGGEPLLDHRDGEAGMDLVRTVAEFTRQISDLYKQHANSLQNVVYMFRQSNDKIKDRSKERTPLLRCWDAMLEEYQAAVQNNFDIANSLLLYVAEPLTDIVSERQKLVTRVKGYHDDLQEETEEMNSALLKSQRNYAETWTRMTKSQGSTKNPFLFDCYKKHNSYVLQLSLVNEYNSSLQDLALPHIVQDLQNIQASVVDSTAHAIIKHAKIIQTRLCDQGRRMDAIVTLTRAVDAKENIGDMQFPANKPKIAQYMFTKPEASVTGDFSQGKLIHHPSTEQSLQETQGDLIKEIDDLENELSELNDKLNKQKRYCDSNTRRGSNIIKRSSEYQTDIYKVRHEMRKIQMIIKTKQTQLELFSDGNGVKTINGFPKNDYVRKSSNHISKMQDDLIRKEFEVTCKEVEDFTNRDLQDDYQHVKRENGGRSTRDTEKSRNEVDEGRKDVNGQIDYGVRRGSIGMKKESERRSSFSVKRDMEKKENDVKKTDKDVEIRKKEDGMKKDVETDDLKLKRSSFERALAESKDSVAELLEKGGRQHIFQDYNFKKPTFCDQCRGLLRGLIKQGLRCKLCKVSIHHKCQQIVPACRGAPPSEKRKLLRRQKSSSEVEGPRDETPRIEIDPVYEAIKSASRMSVRNHPSDTFSSGSSRRKSSPSPTSPNHRHTTSSPGELIDYSTVTDSSSRDSLSPGRSSTGATPKSAPHSPASSRRKMLKNYGKSMSLDAEPQATARGGGCYGYRPRRQQSEIDQADDSEAYMFRGSPIGHVVLSRDPKGEQGASTSLSASRYDGYGSNRTLSRSPSNSLNASSKDIMSSNQPLATECIALYNFEGSVPEDLTFSAGDKVYLLDSSSSEWWKGELDNKVGFFPAFCVEPIQRWERALRVTRSHKGNLERPDGLNLRRDQIAIQMSNVEAGWVTVRMAKGQRGSYPYCYLAPIHHKYFQWGDEIYK
ncbi:uncharacterized protein [Antedon mediterranea]|uniref:uncharacterized protein isoform X2 n=1 Tax=Antedon mediterranea TaxID=105859 RepID=UPI003AF7583C